MNNKSYSESFRGSWYSDFVSPTKNVHHFRLELLDLCDSAAKHAEMTLIADRGASDGRILTVLYRVHVEICGPFIAVLAKDAKTPSDGVNTMVLELIRDDEMRGTFTWNSLTSGTIKSEAIRWTKTPSDKNRAAHKKSTEVSL